MHGARALPTVPVARVGKDAFALPRNCVQVPMYWFLCVCVCVCMHERWMVNLCFGFPLLLVVCVFTRVHIFLSAFLSVCLFVCLFVCMCMCVCARASIHSPLPMERPCR